MDGILAWLGNYSLPVALLIVLAAALLYVLKLITDKSVASQFDRYTQRAGLQLQRRSRFEELILVERYKFLTGVRTKLDKAITNINRTHCGTRIEGFIVNGDIVPLTEVFEDLNNNKYLISAEFFRILNRKAILALDFANATDAASRAEVTAKLTPLNEAFDRLMVDSFGLDQIG